MKGVSFGLGKGAVAAVVNAVMILGVRLRAADSDLTPQGLQCAGKNVCGASSANFVQDRDTSKITKKEKENA